MRATSLDGESWYAATAAVNPAWAPLTVDLDFDVCVIGAGLAGLTAAREVARRGWSVAVLEGRSVGWSASGHNVGLVLEGYAAPAETLVERVGRDHARALWRLVESGAEYVRAAAVESGVTISETGWLHVSRQGDDAATEARVEFLAREIGAAVEFWPTRRVRSQLRSPCYFGAAHHPRAFTLDPLQYLRGLAASAEAAGARIFEDTPAIDIDPAGVRKRVVTPRARLRAGQVVLAGGVHVGSLMRRIAHTLIPVTSYVTVTAPLGSALREAIRYRGGVGASAHADDHHRVVGGDRLMWSGHATTWSGEPRRRVRTLLAEIRGAYPQLGEVAAEYAWSATAGRTVHGMPQIGELAPGVWLLGGFGGQGLSASAMGGELVARGMVDGDQAWRQFSPFELVWAGGAAGRAVTQIHSWISGGRERLENRLARRREAEENKDAIVAAVEPASGEVETPPLVAEKRSRPKRKRRSRTARAANSAQD